MGCVRCINGETLTFTPCSQLHKIVRYDCNFTDLHASSTAIHSSCPYLFMQNFTAAELTREVFDPRNFTSNVGPNLHKNRYVRVYVLRGIRAGLKMGIPS
jgi:hypothetical protein